MKNFVLTSERIPKSCLDSLLSLGFEPIFLPQYSRLQNGVSSHPDMLLFICKDKYFCTKEYREIAGGAFDIIEKLGYSPILCDEFPSPDYPNDIIFNALNMGDHIFCLEKKLSKEIKSYADKHGISIINVKQGYTKCSVCKVSDKAMITSDRSIAHSAKNVGIDVLSISQGHVNIKGYDYGFIGGASGESEDTVYFCGNVMMHPDGEAIIDFCQKHEKRYVSLSNEPLFDVGTLFFLSKL